MLVLGLLVVLLILMTPLHLMVRNMIIRIIIVVAIAAILFAIPGQTTALLAMLMIAVEAIIDFIINAVKKLRSPTEG